MRMEQSEIGFRFRGGWFGAIVVHHITVRTQSTDDVFYWSNLRYLYVIGIVLVGAYNAVDNDSD